jgi:UDP-4-keto-D-QuiNAc 4-reductase
MKKDLLQVLLTGATGFVGRAPVSELVAAGSQVKALVRKPSALHVEIEVEQVVMGFDEIDGEGAITTVFSCVDVFAHASARLHMMENQSANPFAKFRKQN